MTERQRKREIERRRQLKRRRRRRMAIARVLIVLIILGVVGGIGAAKIIKKYSPSYEMSDYSTYYGITGNQLFIMIDGEKSEATGIVSDGRAYIPDETVYNYISPRFYWDSANQIVRITTFDSNIEVAAGTTSYTLNGNGVDAGYEMVRLEDGQMYICLDFIKEFADVYGEFYQEPNRAVFISQMDEVSYSKITKKTELRERGGVKSPVLKEVSKGELVTVKEAVEGWIKVTTEDGMTGYVKESLVSSKNEVKSYEHTYTEPEEKHVYMDEKIYLGWHRIYTSAANANVTEIMDGTAGFNVISPTWYTLADSSGNITDLSSADYVTTCHNMGLKVWGLVSNISENNVDSTTALNNSVSRDNLVNALITSATNCGMDGINVDFEALSVESGRGFVQFIRELSVKCHEYGLVLSVDNYPPQNFNYFYRRDEQSAYADYVVLMAYDEHYSGTEAGSVASIGYVKQAVSDTLEDVPANQLIMGIPLYTRDWTISESGASCESIGMIEATSRITDNNASYEWLDDCGQYYSEYVKDGVTHKIWVENSDSIKEKLNVVNSNNLAGAAYWALGLENREIWNKIY